MWAGRVPLTLFMRSPKRPLSGYSGLWRWCWLQFWRWWWERWWWWSWWWLKWLQLTIMMKIMTMTILRERLHFVYILTLIMLANLRLIIILTALIIIIIVLIIISHHFHSKPTILSESFESFFQRDRQSCLLPPLQWGHEAVEGAQYDWNMQCRHLT